MMLYRKLTLSIALTASIALAFSFSVSASPLTPTYSNVNGYKDADLYTIGRLWDYASEDFLYCYPGGYELSRGSYTLPELATRWQVHSDLVPFYDMISNYDGEVDSTVPLFNGERTYVDNYTRFVIPTWFTSYSTATNVDLVFSLKLNGELTIKAGETFEFYVAKGRVENSVSGSYGNVILNNGSEVNTEFTSIFNVIDATPGNNSGTRPSSPSSGIGALSPLKFEVIKNESYTIQTSQDVFLSEWVLVRSIPIDTDITITRIGFQFSINGASYTYSQINRVNIFMFLSCGVIYTKPLELIDYIPPVESLPPVYGDIEQAESAALDNLDNALNDLYYFSNLVDVESGRIHVMDLFEQVLDMSYLSIIGAVVTATLIIRAVVGR